MSDDIESGLRIANIKEITALSGDTKGTRVKPLIWNFGR